MRLLLVDDDEVTRTLLCGLLEPMGDVTVARDAYEAWRILREGGRFDLCVSDICMPGNGLTLLERVRGDLVLADLPFVLVTAAGDRATVQQAARHGVSGYLLKPISADAVRTTVSRALDAARPNTIMSWLDKPKPRQESNDKEVA